MQSNQNAAQQPKVKLVDVKNFSAKFATKGEVFRFLLLCLKAGFSGRASQLVRFADFRRKNGKSSFSNFTHNPYQTDTAWHESK